MEQSSVVVFGLKDEQVGGIETSEFAGKGR